MSEIMPFDLGGHQMRFGLADDGRPWVAAPDFAKALGYRAASDALRNLDEDEKGTQIVRTPGGDQQLSVLFEEGIWELIFLSRRPEAKALKSQVKAVLREIRETGRYEVPALSDPLADLERQTELTTKAIAIARQERERAVQAERQVAELEPSARSWEVLASAAGDFALRDAALILNRDPNILTGQNLLKRSLADLRMTDRWGTPYAAHKTHLTERPRTYTDRESGEERQAKPQIRVTVAGLKYLHRKLCGVAPLQFDQPPLSEAG